MTSSRPPALLAARASQFGPSSVMMRVGTSVAPRALATLIIVCLGAVAPVAWQALAQTQTPVPASYVSYFDSPTSANSSSNSDTASAWFASPTPVAVSWGYSASAPDAAGTVLTKLLTQSNGGSVPPVTSYNWNTDPDGLLGSPNGYYSKAAAPDAGLTVETFASAAELDARKAALQKLSPEDYYFTGSYSGGNVLLRVSGSTPKTQAADYGSSLALALLLLQ